LKLDELEKLLFDIRVPSGKISPAFTLLLSGKLIFSVLFKTACNSSFAVLPSLLPTSLEVLKQCFLVAILLALYLNLRSSVHASAPLYRQEKLMQK